MLRDDVAGTVEVARARPRNVLGDRLDVCSMKPKHRVLS